MSGDIPEKKKSKRLVSIDALRGFDMFWIIGGGDIIEQFIKAVWNPLPQAVARQFEHAEWIGFTAWDMIMPLFLFIVGASMPFSMSGYLKETGGRKLFYRRLAKRFIILFILGIAIQGNLFKFDPAQLHLYCNTLQAIACGYVVAAVVILNLRLVWQIAACVALLAGYWALMMLVPVPGYGAGVLEPSANLALYIDELILGRFRDGTPYTWILSSMTFSATVLMGVMSGYIIKSGNKPAARFWMLAGAGLGCLAAGYISGIWFPIIKHIWSSSFALCAGGWCFLLLAAFYGIIDIAGLKKWSFFFVVIGSNALFVYSFTEFMGSYITKGIVIVMETMHPAVVAGVALSAFGALWLLLYIMYRKEIFIRV
ncbi:MAG TPA: DUF5009 domain-containing protein [bacterium]|nr:DUF5009 domain-containing protein [bacterium]